MRLQSLAVPVLASLLSLQPAAAAEFFPAEQGTVWHYVTPSGQHDDLVAGGLVTVQTGETMRLCRALTFAPGSVHEGLTLFLELLEDASVKLAARSDGTGAGLYFDWPLVMLPVPANYGAEPTMYLCKSFATPSGEESIVTYWVSVEQASITVPAGTFEGVTGGMRVLYGIGDWTDVGDVWAAGVGLVQYQHGEFFRLASVSGATPAATSSWGAVKRRYR